MEQNSVFEVHLPQKRLPTPIGHSARPAAKITGLNSSGTLLCMMGLSLRGATIENHVLLQLVSPKNLFHNGYHANRFHDKWHICRKYAKSTGHPAHDSGCSGEVLVSIHVCLLTLMWTAPTDTANLCGMEVQVRKTARQPHNCLSGYTYIYI